MSLYNHQANWTVSMSKKPCIADFCTPMLVTVDPEAQIEDIMTIMEEASIRHIPVVRDGRAIGIISERDLKVFEDREFAAKFCASDIMIEDPYMVKEDESLFNVVSEMDDRRLGSCLIVDLNGKITGIFTMIDALKILKQVLKK